MNKLLTTAAFAAGSLAIVSSANALVSSRQASVTIVEPLTFTVVSDLAFGKIQKPTTGTQTAVMTSAGALSGTATSLGGTTTGASYTIKGDATQTIGITVADDTTDGVAGVSLGSFTTSYNNATFTNGATGLAAPTTTGKSLVFGATLTIDSTTVTAGVKTPAYNVTVVYQ
jgi:hypothetical protein